MTPQPRRPTKAWLLAENARLRNALALSDRKRAEHFERAGVAQKRVGVLAQEIESLKAGRATPAPLDDFTIELLGLRK